VADALEAVDFHLALDVLGDVATEVTFDSQVLVDVETNLVDVSLGEVLDADRLVDASVSADLLRGGWSYTKDVGQRNHRALVTRNVYSGNTGHIVSLLALTLLVAWVLADHANVTGPANDFALLTHGFNAGANLHVFSFSNVEELELFVAVGDAAAGHVVGRDLDLHLVTGENADAVHAHFSRTVGENGVTILEFHTEHGVG